VLGIVENMAYVTVPGSATPLEVFGPSQGPQLVAESGAPLLGRLPIDPALTTLVDAGRIEEYRTDAYAELAENFLREVRRADQPEDAASAAAG
jgi:hypothetical protein